MDDFIQNIGSLIIEADDLANRYRDSAAVVFDVSKGHIANSGFMYIEDKIKSIIADVDTAPMIIDNKVWGFQRAIEEKFGHKFKQLLVQIEKESSRIKIDFEFDDPKRWNMDLTNYIKMREALRPVFD